MSLLLALTLLACRPTGVVPPTRDSDPDEPGETLDSGVEHIPPALGCGPDDLFSDSEVHAVGVDLSAEAIAALEADPYTYVEGALTFRGRRLDPVGVRLKGHSSFQSFDGKPAFKIDLDHVHNGWELCGLEHLTFDNNVWDTSMMAETLAYRSFRQIGAPAPRTGYATITLNGEPMGLYTLVEAMDGDFVEARWPGSAGGLWEMNRNCDFTGACDCFDLQWSGDDFDDTALARACAAVAEGTVEGLWRAFDRDALLAFMAAEMVVNHPDSYTYNLNNWHMVHEPIADRIFLSPWGADSTFIYYYPPSDTHPCEVWDRYDNFTDGILGQLTWFCRFDDPCWAELGAATREAADAFEAMDMPTLVAQYRALISDEVHADPRVAWPTSYFDHKVDCLESWTATRPQAVRAWVDERDAWMGGR
ncbi:MAG: CotH kinase family protein [Pseudomonadota bacterium]